MDEKDNNFDENSFFGVPRSKVKKIAFYYITHKNCQTFHSCESTLNEMLKLFDNKNIPGDWGIVNKELLFSDLRRILKWKNSPLILELFIRELEINSLIEIKKIKGKLFIQWNESHTFLIAVFERFFEKENKYTRYHSIQQLKTLCKNYFLNKEGKKYNQESLITTIKEKTIPKKHREFAKLLFTKIDPHI